MIRMPAVRLVVALNVIVYLLWLFSPGDEPKFMTDNFLVSWQAISEGRFWTLITSAFSHIMFLHIFVNMYVLLSFGGVVETLLGSLSFLGLYLFGAILSGISHSLFCLWLLNEPNLPALGASGSVSALVVLFSMIFPKEKVLFFGIIPAPAAIVAVIAVGLDIWGLVEQARGGASPIGHGAHLGGALAGALYFVFVVRPKMRSRRFY